MLWRPLKFGWMYSTQPSETCCAYCPGFSDPNKEGNDKSFLFSWIIMLYISPFNFIEISSTPLLERKTFIRNRVLGSLVASIYEVFWNQLN